MGEKQIGWKLHWAAEGFCPFSHSRYLHPNLLPTWCRECLSRSFFLTINVSCKTLLAFSRCPPFLQVVSLYSILWSLLAFRWSSNYHWFTFHQTHHLRQLLVTEGLNLPSLEGHSMLGYRHIRPFVWGQETRGEGVRADGDGLKLVSRRSWSASLAGGERSMEGRGDQASRKINISP